MSVVGDISIARKLNRTAIQPLLADCKILHIDSVFAQ